MRDNKITICFNRLKKFGVEDMADVVGHELIHALDTCQGYDNSSCSERVCTEIRAYSFCNCSDDAPLRSGRTREECIKFGTFTSTTNYGGCRGYSKKELNNVIDLMFAKCQIDPCMAPTDYPLNGDGLFDECHR